MSSPLRILYASSEVVPYSKTGGLADVAGALPSALAAQGADVRVISPFYAALFHRNHPTAPYNGAAVQFEFNGTKQPFKLRQPANGTGPVQHLFVEHPNYYSRRGLYVEADSGRDYPDNDVRFAFLSRGILEWLSQSEWIPDVIHLNDWQTALVAAYLKENYHNHSSLQGIRTLLTVHNLAYQGVFAPERFAFLGFDPPDLAPLSPFEFFGKVNFLKAGLVNADKINTVSPTYAREIQSSPELGAGLEGLLQQRSDDLSGILNGIDTEVWNPSSDPLIPVPYDSQNLADKVANKRALVERCGFAPQRVGHPLIGMITRLADQKGLDLIVNAADKLFALDANMVLLGAGDLALQDFFESWDVKYAGRFRAFLTFDDTLSHLIEAGSDMFLMPSRYEPCGLNQMYSLRYGTVPVVRATGGLADTVHDADVNRQSGNGFTFTDYTSEAMLDATKRALTAYSDRARWQSIIQRGMAADFSWKHAASAYIDLYHAALDR